MPLGIAEIGVVEQTGASVPSALLRRTAPAERGVTHATGSQNSQLAVAHHAADRVDVEVEAFGRALPRARLRSRPRRGRARRSPRLVAGAPQRPCRRTGSGGRVVVQVRPDARQSRRHGDAERAQLGRFADAGTQEECRGVVGAGADDRAAGLDLHVLPARRTTAPRACPPSSSKPLDRCIAADAQRWPSRTGSR